MVCRSASSHGRLAQALTRVVLEKHVVGQDHRRPAAGFQGAHDVLDEGQLLVGRVGGDREVGSVRAPASLFGAEGRVGQDQVGLAQALAVWGQAVAQDQGALDAVQHHVHQGEALSVGHQLHADEGVVALKEPLGLAQGVEVVGRRFDVVVGGHQEARRAGRRVLDHLPGLGLHQAHHAVDQRARGEILPGAGFLSPAFFSSRPS